MKIEKHAIEEIFNTFNIDVSSTRETLKGITAKLHAKENLTEREVVVAMCFLMSTDTDHADSAAYLSALHEKGETEEEIATSARVMRIFSTKIYTEENKAQFDALDIVDCCGTGGGLSIFNISTLVAIVLAASGLSVAKHGNRAITSQSGSADILEAFGVNITIPPHKVGECILKNKIGFLFAPHFHRATKNVQQVRKSLPHKTIFNLLGPLTNPAEPTYQIIGVYDPHLTEIIARVLKLLGVKRAAVCHGYTPCGKGMDEVSTLGKTKVSEVLPNGEITTYVFDVADVGIKEATYGQFTTGDAATLAPHLRTILSGNVTGPDEEIVVVNAAFGLLASNRVATIQEGVQQARAVIHSGACNDVLERFIAFTHAR